MDKRQRLEIDFSEITAENISATNKLIAHQLNGLECYPSEHGEDHYFFDENGNFLIPVLSWLKEIIEPMNFAEWDDQQDFGILEPSINQREKTWHAAIENDHLRMKQTLDLTKKAYLDDHCGDDEALRIQSEFIWNSIVETLFLEPTDDNT